MQTILIYDVNDSLWESKGNFHDAVEENDEINIPMNNDGNYYLDILGVSMVIILNFFVKIFLVWF